MVPFCKQHKLQEMETELHEQGYPIRDIDWDGLSARVADHYSWIRRHLSNPEEESSKYRRELERNGKQLKAKGADFEVPVPGYYGMRGAEIIRQAIFDRFLTLLEKSGKTDKLILKVGVPNYVNAVLVPEVSVRLVMTDMRLDDYARARSVIRDTAGYGMLKNDVRDKVRDDHDEDGNGDEESELDEEYTQKRRKVAVHDRQVEVYDLDSEGDSLVEDYASEGSE
jgi:hypothetical protein